MKSRRSTWFKGREDKKIIIVSSIILIVIALISGFVSILGITSGQVDIISRAFQNKLHGKQVALALEINRGTKEVNAIHNSQLFKQIFEDESRSNDPESLNLLLQLFLAEGFTGVSVYDQYGKSIATLGHFIDRPELQVELNTPNKTQLLYKNGWYLQENNTAMLENKELNFITVEWPLFTLNELLPANPAMGTTADLLLCASTTKDKAECFPSRMNSKVTTFALTGAQQFIPVKKALLGQTGIIKTSDNFHHRVLAAYAPVGNLGLAMVLKMDLNDIYKPILDYLQLSLPFIVIAICGGILLLRFMVLPLLNKVTHTEKQLLKSNQLLRENEERYSLSVAGGRVGLWDWDINTNKVFYAPQFKVMLGYADNELPNDFSSIENNLHPDDKEKVIKQLRKHIKDYQPYSIECRLRTKSGEYKWFQMSGQALSNNEGNATRMSGTVADITERKIEQRIMATQNMITQLLSEAPSFDAVSQKIVRVICEGSQFDYGAIWSADYETNTLIFKGYWHKPAVSMQEFIDATQKTPFYPSTGILGDVWKSAKPYWVEDITQNTGFVRLEEAKLANLKFAYFIPIMIGYTVVAIIELFSTQKKVLENNVSKMMEIVAPQMAQFIQRKRVELALRESEAHKSAILESAQDSIISIDHQGKLISWNAKTEAMFLYSHKELQEKNIEDLFPGLMNKLKKVDEKSPLEFMAQQGDGEFFPVELTISAMVIKEEPRFVIIIRDTTERKKVDALKKEFISVVSHELRTPITSIRGSLGLILGGAVGEFSGKLRTLLEIANNNCERLLLLINDILDVEKIEAGKMEFHLKPVDINKLIAEAININQMYADKFSIKLEVSTCVINTLVYVDPDRFIQVMTNLISNAVKFSFPGGKVIVSTESLDGKIRISVVDHGSGISDEFKSRIFQKFSQADSSNIRNKGGTGLGLSISKAIIEKLSGTINFISEPNIRTVFYIDLPKWTRDDENVQLIKNDESKEIRLLICEDDQSQADYLHTLLESAGYVADIATTAREAKEKLDKQHYDALLLDLILPDKDGIGFIRELRNEEATRDLPIIVISVFTEAGKTLINGDGLSVVDWLEKPINFAKLSQAIQVIRQHDSLPRVLHVEDEHDIQKIVAQLLSDSAIVCGVDTLSVAKEELSKQDFDLVILDLILPDGNGAELLPLLSKKQIPVLVFSTVELDKEYAEFVSQALKKSEISHEDLIIKIKEYLRKSERRSIKACQN